MRFVSFAAAVGLLLGAVVLVWIDHPYGLLAMLAVGFLCRSILWHSPWRALRSTTPVLVFGGFLWAGAWISGTASLRLPLKSIGVFLYTSTALRMWPWDEWISRVGVNSPFYSGMLFVLFVRHFLVIFTSEARRLFQARALGITKSYGPGSFRSLVAAVAAILRRSLVRAERFYAALWLRGLTK